MKLKKPYALTMKRAKQNWKRVIFKASEVRLGQIVFDIHKQNRKEKKRKLNEKNKKKMQRLMNGMGGWNPVLILSKLMKHCRIISMMIISILMITSLTFCSFENKKIKLVHKYVRMDGWTELRT